MSPALRRAFDTCRRASARHGDLALALGLAAVTLVSRWPYRARMLYNWDAVQFALALHEFDVAKHQPHPPGYLLYVALGRLLNASLGDPTLAYVALAMLFSAGTTFVLYGLARRLYDRATAVAAAALLAVSPLFWFYGSVGLTYAGEACAASVVAWFAYGTLTGSVRDLYWGALALGLAGGMRPSVLVLLLPLWLGCAVIGVEAWRRRLIAGSILLVAVLAWLLPMLWLTGGPAAYLAASTQLYGSVLLPTSVLGGSLEITLAQLRYLLESTLVGLGPLSLIALALPWYARREGWRVPEWFLLAWMLPAGVFYTLIHFGQAGYVLTFLPALVVLLSRVLVRAVAAGSERLRRPNWRWALTTAAMLPLLLVNTGFFVSARPLPREFNNRGGDAWVWRARDEFHDWIMSRTAAALREHEAVIRTYVETIRAVYDPSDTVLVTELGNPRSYPWLRHAMFYMPEYPIYQVQVGAMPLGFYAPQSAATMILTPGSRITLPAEIRQLVWFVDHWDPAMSAPEGLREVELPHGRYLYVLPLTRSPAEYAGYTFERAPR
ncbi:MAG TPA: glycosyltransferase family 39 protein [Candidatus Dormibacteraeota bacterium]|nr:glycosyltransferase family 39 protein [Candidatus Dormibacteraeota bacterium]